MAPAISSPREQSPRRAQHLRFERSIGSWWRGIPIQKSFLRFLDARGELTPQQLLSRDKYLEGLAAYREQQWDEALRALNESVGAIPDEGPSMALLKRAESLKANPHPEIGTGRGTSTNSCRGGYLWRQCLRW